ncbi:MAG: cell division protein FtsZ [Polyangia bacterium]|jgi:cell division protein FtsZ
MLEFDEPNLGPKIKVVGVGGGGGNAVNTMIEGGIQGVDFVAANTDCQVLETNQAPTKIQIGKTLTKGLGAGANPDIGCAAALEDAQRIGEVLGGADMVFVTAGMGGGTGTGAAPVIARAARELGALTVGVVTKPFLFEGLQRKKKAVAGIAELAKSVDALIVIPNDRLISLAGRNLTLRESFNMVDNVCLTAVRGISDLVMVPGLINVDFADVRSIMTGMGKALMGSGAGKGEKRALDAAQMAITSPLLEDVSINGATGILVNITGGPDLTLAEVNEACSLVHEAADPDANIIFGSVIDPNLSEEVRITVIATGFQSRLAAAESSNARAGARVTVKRPAEAQMTLPMHSGNGQAVARIALGSAAEACAMQEEGVLDAAGTVAPVAQPFEPIDTDVEIDEPELSLYPPPSSLLTPAPHFAHGAVSLAAPSQGPVIRPQVASAMAPASGGSSARRVAQVAAPSLATSHLGIEESEFDKPTYLRRALAGESARYPGEHKG